MDWSSFVIGLTVGIFVTSLIAGYWANWMMTEMIGVLRDTNEIIDSNTRSFSAILRAGESG